jgi:adenosylcobinamide-phosphate synthase
MVGYKNHYRHLGWASARCDDLLNWIPARITAGLLMLAGACLRFFHPDVWTIAWRDHGKTPSPNGGWPMATMAGLLRVRLCKPGVYTLGRALRAADSQSLTDAWRLTRLAGNFGFILTIASLFSGAVL